jgi:hypothetical protein
MAKSTTPYWNPLTWESQGRWTPVSGLEGMAEELTLSMDPATGEYTRLTRFQPGADTTPFGGKSHDYRQERGIPHTPARGCGVNLDAGHISGLRVAVVGAGQFILHRSALQSPAWMLGMLTHVPDLHDLAHCEAL